MSYANGMKADVFHVKTDQCQNYWKLWLDRLHTYHERTKKTGTYFLILKIKMKKFSFIYPYFFFVQKSKTLLSQILAS